MKDFWTKVLLFLLLFLLLVWLFDVEDSGQRCGDNTGTIYGACNP